MNRLREPPVHRNTTDCSAALRVDKHKQNVPHAVRPCVDLVKHAARYEAAGALGHLPLRVGKLSSERSVHVNAQAALIKCRHRGAASGERRTAADFKAPERRPQ